MNTDVTARFSKQIMEGINNPSCLLYYIYDEEGKSPVIEKIGYELGCKIIAVGEHYDEDLNEKLPRFPVHLTIIFPDASIRIYTT